MALHLSVHVLLHCEALNSERQNEIEKIINAMPQGMQVSFYAMNDCEKIIFMLSGLKSKCTLEWPDVYEAIARWVYCMYELRKCMYDALGGEP